MQVRSVTTFEEWRNAARALLIDRMPPAAVDWGDSWALRGAAGSGPPSCEPRGAAGGGADQSANPDVASGGSPHSRPLRIPASLLRLLETVAMFRAAGRWELMYRLVWRAMHENGRVLEDAADPDVRHACTMERAVNRDVHKMHAFVRFREVTDAQDRSSYFAWFEPQHEILRRGAVFFVQRFPNMVWTIATPDGAAAWNLRDLSFIDSPDAGSRPREDGHEDLWRIYYRSICNVARINPAAMQREMPQRYWKHLPEAREIDVLVRDGAARVGTQHRESLHDGVPMTQAVKRSLPAPAQAGESPQTCRRCDLWKNATQAVEGEGAQHAKVMLVGEQPGDEEDVRGHPFVGPAGKVLDQAIAAAGLKRDQVFITNAVKHFKWEPRGKRRLHKKPGTTEIKACNLWLEQEIGAVKPVVIVALGATALKALTGAALSIEGARQQQLEHPGGAHIIATYHPSAILRAEGERGMELRAFLESDLRKAAQYTSRETS